MTTATKIIISLGFVLALGVLGYFVYGKVASTENRADTVTTATSSDGLTTSYFGNMVNADLNSDGKQDSAFIVTQTGSGSGTFYYLAHTLGGEASFLGDRIAPQSTEWRNGQVIVNYADRKPGEPMTTKPSVGVTRYFKAEGNTLVEIKNTPTQGATTTSNGEKCTARGGIWSEQYKECTGINRTSCRAIGGTFNECASACRHDPGATVCIMMCVAVCTF